jgi:hypothetical protein
MITAMQGILVDATGSSIEKKLHTTREAEIVQRIFDPNKNLAWSVLHQAKPNPRD